MRQILFLLLLISISVKGQNDKYTVEFDINDHLSLKNYAEKNFDKTSSIPILIYLRLIISDSVNSIAYLDRLDEIFHRNLIFKDNKISVIVPKKLVRKSWKYYENGKTYENNFDFIDLNIMSYLGPIDFTNDTLNQAEKYIKKLKGLTLLLSEEKEKNYGWFWDVMAKYYINLRENGHIEAYSYIISKSRKEKEVIYWININQQKIEEFILWENNYKWQ